MKFTKFIFRVLYRFVNFFQKKIYQIFINIIKLFTNLFFKILNPNVKFFNKKYSGTYYTENGEDLYLTSLLFNNLISNQENLIVEVGISGPYFLSKSLIFETHFNCKVVNIGLINQYNDLWKSERPRAHFINYSIDTNQNLHATKLNNRSNYLKELNFFCSNYNPDDFLISTVKTRPLIDILNDLELKEVLILFLDFNFYNLDTIYRIDLKDIYIKCICLNFGKFSLYNQYKIQKYLKNNGFKYEARIGEECGIFIRYSLINGIEISDLI